MFASALRLSVIGLQEFAKLDGLRMGSFLS